MGSKGKSRGARVRLWERSFLKRRETIHSLIHLKLIFSKTPEPNIVGFEDRMEWQKKIAGVAAHRELISTATNSPINVN